MWNTKEKISENFQTTKKDAKAL